MMPSPQESPWVIAGAGKQLATWGSPGVAPLARLASMFAQIVGPFLDFYGEGKFSQNFNAETARQMAMRREEMEMNRQRMIDTSYQAWQASKAHSDVYRDILFKIHNNYYSKNSDENQRLGYEAFINAARTDPNGPDSILIQQAANGGLSAAESMIDQRDAKAHDLYLSAVSMDNAPGRSGVQKSKEDTAMSASIDPVGTTGGLPGPGGAPVGSAPLGGETAEPGHALDEQIKRRNQISDDAMQDARDMYHGEKPRGMTPDAYHKAIGEKFNRVDQARKDLSQGISNEASSSDDAQTKIDKIKDMDEHVGGILEAAYNNTLDPKSADGKKWNSLAHQAFPGPAGYDENGFKAVQDMKKEGTNTISASMRRTGTLAAAYVSTMGELKDISETDPDFVRKLKTALATGLGDPKYTSLATSLRNFGTDAVAIAYGTGRAPVSMVQHYLDNLPAGASPAQVRGWLQKDLQNANGAINAVKGDWARLHQVGLPPGLQEDADQVIQYGIITNVNTGQVAKGAPDVLKAVGNPAPSDDPKKRPSWLTPDKARPPPDTPEDAAMITHALANPDAPGSQDILHHWGY
jgi:hypothetical protein